jgi:hypothetical protein
LGTLDHAVSATTLYRPFRQVEMKYLLMRLFSRWNREIV